MKRGFISLNKSSAVIIADEYSFNERATPQNISWQLHTKCEPLIDSQIVNLKCFITNDIGAQPVVGLLATLPEGTVCPSWQSWSTINVTKLLPDPPFESAAHWTRLDQFAGASTMPCNSIVTALGQVELVQKLIAAKPGKGLTVRPLSDWATSGPLV